MTAVFLGGGRERRGGVSVSTRLMRKDVPAAVLMSTDWWMGKGFEIDQRLAEERELRLEDRGEVMGDLGEIFHEDKDRRLEEGELNDREDRVLECRNPCLLLAHGEVILLYQSLLRV